MSKFLIHVGYPKAASSFIGKWFHQNPAFQFKDFRLLGFDSTADFCNYSMCNNPKTKYFVIRDMIFSAPLAKNVHSCKNLNDYQEKICKNLHSLFPDSKILIVTRGYESAIKAIYSEYLKQGGRLSFKNFIESENKTEWYPINYSFLIALYKNYFGHENVLAIPFELLKKDSKAFLNEIEIFLQIDPFEFKPDVVNRSLKNQNMTLLRILNNTLYFFLYISGPLHKMFYNRYVRCLNNLRKIRFLILIFDLLSKIFVGANTHLDKKICIEKCSSHSVFLNNLPLFLMFKEEYFLE